MWAAIPSRLNDIVTPVSEFGGEADSSTVRWARRMGLTRTAEAEQRIAATRPGSLAAHCYPIAGTGDLCLLADWITWLFILDDHNDEGSYGWDPESLEKALAGIFFAVEGEGTASNPLAAGFADIVRRLRGRMSERWLHRFLHHVIDYFTAYVWQSAHRRAAETPDLDVFPRMRRDAGAIMPSFDLIEFVMSETLPARLYYGAVYQRLLVTAANVVCWTNDLMTVEKELAKGDEQNLVMVISRARGVSLERAAAEVAERVEKEIERFLAAEQSVARALDGVSASDELRTVTSECVAMLRAWMRGHVDWGRSTVRYLDFAPSSASPDYIDDLLAEGSGAKKDAETT